MAEKPLEEAYISVVDEEPEIFELLKWGSSHSQPQKQPEPRVVEKVICQEKKIPKFREEADPFDLPDPAFIESYRLPKDLVHNLCEELTPLLADSMKAMEFSVESKVLAALSFYATGKYQKSIGGKTDPSVTQYFVSTAVLQVTEAMNDASIVKKYIHFPHLRHERDTIKSKFFMKYGVPNVVGVVECMHVPIARPDLDTKSHFNKSYHSKKVQIICDSESNIISVDASPGGSYSHDVILNQHAVKNDLQSLKNSNEPCWLIGGPHYKQRTFIMTPIPKITKKSPVSPEKYYTTLHSQIHSIVTNTITQLKSRWKCLQASSNKHFDPATVSMMVIACCILHNICTIRGMPLIPMTPAEERLEAMKQKVANGPISRKQIEDEDGVQARLRLVERLWMERSLSPEQASASKKRSKKERLLEHQKNNQIVMNVPTEQQPLQNYQLHPNHMTMDTQQNMNHQLHPDDISKRPRTLMNTPYTLPVTPGWGHFPSH